MIKDSETPVFSLDCGHRIHFTYDKDKEGHIERVNAEIGKNGKCLRTLWNGLSIIITIALKHGATIDEIGRELRGLHCEGANNIGQHPHSGCLDALARYVFNIKEDIKPEVK